MTWKELIDQTEEDFKKELQEYSDSEDPWCHAANWNHFKDRINKNLDSMKKDIEEDYTVHVQLALNEMIVGMKPVVEQWLECYRKRNGNGFYDAWLETFWSDESLNRDDEERCYMTRLYEKYIKEGEIEIFYYYDYAADEIKQKFLDKWYQKYNCPYPEGEELRLYIGQRNHQGKFYEDYRDFYEPLDNKRESDWWGLIIQISETD